MPENLKNEINKEKKSEKELKNMEKRFFLALFNEKTWNEFLLQEKKVYGTTKKKQKKASKIKKGDYLICYVSKVSKFVGILQVRTKVFFDNSQLWEDSIFPVRFSVKPIVTVKSEDGIFVKKLKRDLLLFSTIKKENYWGGFFINAFNEFYQEDGEFIYNEFERIKK